MRNSEFINFDKLHEFGLKDDLKNVNSVHVDRFLKRVVEEILSDNAYILLNNLSLLNINLEGNIHRESVEESFNIPNINRCFNELIATGIESARENKEKSIGFLKKAIKLDKKYIEEAKKNDDYFDNLKDSNVFKEVI